MKSLPRVCPSLLLSLLLLAVAGSARAQTALPSITVGVAPVAIACDPVQNKIYTANAHDLSVTVIDGKTGQAFPITVDDHPMGLAVDPAASRLFVACQRSGTVDVINETTGASTPVTVGTLPRAIAVNPVTHTAFVANAGDGTVTVIDGATLAATTVTVGTTPSALAVNPQSNLVYVANAGSGDITIIDGATLGTRTVAAGTSPSAVAINPATNRVYVANAGSGTLTVLNEAKNTVSTLPVGNQPSVLAVNPATNTIYVANTMDGTVSVIDGVTTATATVTVGANPRAIAIDAAANQIYVANGDGTVTAIDGATTATTTLTGGVDSSGVAANPITHRVYVANTGDLVNPGTVSVFDGATNVATSLPVGNAPTAVAVNAVSGRVFVSNEDDGTVSVIDTASKALMPYATSTGANTGVTLAVNPVTGETYVANRTENTVTVLDAQGNPTAINVAVAPTSIAVNPLTNQVYVGHDTTNVLTIINGTSKDTSTVTKGLGGAAVAVNAVTNLIYFADSDAGTVTVLDGATHTTTAIAIGSAVGVLALNPETGRVYVINRGNDSVTVIDGTSVIATVAAGSVPKAIAVNIATNQVYIANTNGSSLTVIDGATNSTSTIPLGQNPTALAVNAATNQIYVSHEGGSAVSVIDGATRSVSTVATTAGPGALAIDPATGEVYVSHRASGTVTVIAPSASGTGKLATFVDAIPGNLTNADPVVLNLTAVSLYGPVTQPVQRIYYQVDTTNGPWLPATPAGATGTASLSGLLAGQHTLYAFASDGLDATSVNSGSGSSAIPGRVTASSFLTSGGGGSFAFDVTSVIARNTDGKVTLHVQRNFTTPATVDYETQNGTALAGTHFGATRGTLSFARGEQNKTFDVPLVNGDLGQGVLYFSVQLSNPSGTAVVGNPGSMGIYLLNAFSSDLAISRLQARPPTDGAAVIISLTVNLTFSPPGPAGQWRLFGETAWRDSGKTALGLTPGNYQVQFRPVSGYDTPEPQAAVLTSDHLAATASATYLAGAGGDTGSLSVALAPAGVGAWRLLGENTFRASGTSAPNLAAGSYLVEFADVLGRATPESREVFIASSQVTLITQTYQLEDASTGPKPVPEADIPVSDPRHLPAASFTGRIQTDNGSGTGFVPLDRIVVTAAHVLFDDGTLSFATGTRWLFQQNPGVFETPPQIPRGTYVLDGYAAQRTADGAPGASTPASQRLDAAAMYFLEPTARGGESGYLASNAPNNPWLTNATSATQRDKFLAGYPAADTAATGRLHVTPITTASLTAADGGIFTSDALTGFPGMGGGPLFAGYNDGVQGEVFYPAAIYLGGTAQTVVRAINSQVADLMERAEVSGNGGANNVGGGITHVNGGLSGNTALVLGSLNVLLQPAAIASAARWGLTDKAINRRSGDEAIGLLGGDYTVRFNSVNGYTSPASFSVTVAAGHPALRTATYVPLPPMIIDQKIPTAVQGQPFSYTIKTTPAARSFASNSLLPQGLTLNVATGVISGTPLETGAFPLKVTATNAQGSGDPAMLQLVVAQAGRLTVTTTGSGSVTKKLAGETIQAVDAVISITATPDKGSVLQDWSTTDPVTGERQVLWRRPTYTFEMPKELALQATFIENPFPVVAGTYNGLLRGAGGLGGRGGVVLTITNSGAFTGTLTVGTRKYPLRGTLETDGSFASNVVLKGAPPVLLTLQVDMNKSAAQIAGGTGTEQITGGALVDGAALGLQAWRAIVYTAKAPSPQARGEKALAHYVGALPHGTGDAVPKGDGYFTLAVSPLGAAHLTGKLGDGTSWSAGLTLGRGGEFPVLALPYKASGIVTGLLNIAAPTVAAGTPAVQGPLDWIKLETKTSLFYPGAFSTVLDARGVPLGKTPLTGFPQVTVTISGGALAATPGPFQADFDTKGVGTAAALGKTFSLKIAPTTGMFTGFFPDGAKTRPFTGIFLPGPAPAGFGFFNGLQKETGAVEF